MKWPRWDCCGTRRHFHDQSLQVQCHRAGLQQVDHAKQLGYVFGMKGGSRPPRLLANGGSWQISFANTLLFRRPSPRERTPMGRLRVRECFWHEGKVRSHRDQGGSSSISCISSMRILGYDELVWKQNKKKGLGQV